jgi:sensor domain CHASE-containing protein
MEFTAMSATVQLQLSFNSLVEAVSSLDLTEKQQLQEIIEQQIFEAEDDLEQDPQVLVEVAAARQAYQNGDYQTVQAYAASLTESDR